MAFVLTHTQVVKEGRWLGEELLEPMRAVIVGGNAMVFSPDIGDESAVGTYTGDAAKYEYPEVLDAGFVDPASVAVTAEMALLRYEELAFKPLPGHANKVPLPADEDVAGDRGIQVGDVVKIGDVISEIMAVATEQVEDEEYKVAVLSRNIPVEMREQEQIYAELCLTVHDVEFSNVEVESDGVSLSAGMHLLTPDWAPAGKPEPLPLVAAEIKLGYKVWYPGLADQVRVAYTEEDIAAIPGEDVGANDLKKAVSLAFANSGGMPVAYIAVADPRSLESWVASLNRVRKDYGIVPCSTDPAVLAAVEDLVEQRSRAESGRECVAWISLTTTNTGVVADHTNSEDHEPLMGVVTQMADGPMIEVPDGNARFMELGVRRGDILRYGEDDYAEYVVQEVVNEDAVRVQGGIKPCDEPTLISIWRKLDLDEQATAVANKAAAYQNKRIRAVWPDSVVDDREDLAGWHLCAALAGLRSGCAPHRDLTGVRLVGVSAGPRIDMFDDDQLDMMAECGVWIVVERDGYLVTRRALTSAEYGDPTSFDEAVVSNLDAINKELREELARLLRTTAASPRFTGRVTGKLRQKLNKIMARRVPNLGPQLVAGDIDVVRRHVYLEDSLVLNVKLTIPRPHGQGLGMPQMEVHQKVIA